MGHVLQVPSPAHPLPACQHVLPTCTAGYLGPPPPGDRVQAVLHCPCTMSPFAASGSSGAGFFMPSRSSRALAPRSLSKRKTGGQAA